MAYAGIPIRVERQQAVVIVGVMLYFVFVLAALALWLLPGTREFASTRLQWLWRAGQRVTRGTASATQRASGSTLMGVAQGARQGTSALREHARPLLAAVALLLLVPAVTLALRHWWALDTFDHTFSRNVNPQVAALLRGEQLVPPLALPPELFLTREVTQARPLAGTANRQWELLDAEFRQRLLGVFKLMREQHGLEMVLVEGFRSPERQAELAGLGPSVTLAGAGESWHQYGMAADSAFLMDGRIVISETDPRAARGYELYGAVAQSFGLTWGGSWRSIKDLGHVELRRTGVMVR